MSGQFFSHYLINELSDYIEELKISGPAQATLPPELTNYFQQHQVSAQAQETQLTELLDYLRQQPAKGPTGSTTTSGKTPGEQIKEIGRVNGISNAKGKRLELLLLN